MHTDSSRKGVTPRLSRFAAFSIDQTAEAQLCVFPFRFRSLFRDDDVSAHVMPVYNSQLLKSATV